MRRLALGVGCAVAIGLSVLGFRHLHRGSLQPTNHLVREPERSDSTRVTIDLPEGYVETFGAGAQWRWERDGESPVITAKGNFLGAGHVFPEPECGVTRDNEPAITVDKRPDGYLATCRAIGDVGLRLRRYFQEHDGAECIVQLASSETELSDERRQQAAAICDSLVLEPPLFPGPTPASEDPHLVSPLTSFHVEVAADATPSANLEAKLPRDYRQVSVGDAPGYSVRMFRRLAGDPLITFGEYRSDLDDGCEHVTEPMEREPDGTRICRHPDRTVVETSTSLGRYNLVCEVTIFATYATTVWERRDSLDSKRPPVHEVDRPLPAAVMSQRIADAKLVCKSMKVLPNEKSTQP